MKKLIVICLMSVPLALYSQKEEKDQFLPDANESFLAGNYVDAEANYRISQSKFPKKASASYNLGNAIYKMEQPSEAKNAYRNAIENATTYAQKHRAYHNLGNVFMKEKDYTRAVEAYKQALINNPEDDQTRYNYALAKKFLKENPPQDKNKKDKQDKKQDNEKKPNENEKDNEQDKNDQNKDSQNNKNQDKKEEPKDKPKPKPQPAGISKQRLENLLDAVNNEERKVQDKVKAKKVEGKPVKNQKDW